MTEEGDTGNMSRRTYDSWRQLFYASLDAILLTSLDGSILAANVEACRLFGMNKEEICRVGRDGLVDPADSRLVFLLEERARNGKARGELRMKRAAGTLFPATVASAIYWDSSGSELTCMVIRDLTEQQRLNEKLRQNESRYRALYEKTPAMVHSIDRTGRFIAVSDHWLDTLGYRRDEVLGHSPVEFMTEESRRLAEKELLPAFFRTGTLKNVPMQMRKKSGEVLDLLLSATAELDDAGEVIRSLAVLVDITERKEAEEQIERLNTDLANRAAELANANSEMEAFNHTVSHDLRLPLTPISGFAQLLQELYDERLDEQGKGFLREIIAATQRMRRLIDTLLKFSEVSYQEMKKVPVDLSTIAADVVAELQQAEPLRQVQVVIAKRLKTNGDPLLLRIMLANLIGNAWKYTVRTKDAVIEFGTTERGGRSVHFVRDNGAGFAMELADRLFMPFQRLHRGEDYEGSGIGLATVQRVVHRHKGKVWAEGEEYKGATFYFTLGEP